MKRARFFLASALLVGLIQPAAAQASFPGANGRIAFVDPSGGIFSMDATGADRQPLFDDPASFEQDPAWSADGRKLAFSSGGNIFAADADGSNATPLTAGGSSGNPTWSPDGTQIAFERASLEDPNGAIYVVNSEGGPATLWLEGSDAVGDVGQPDWSPDGNKIAFIAEESDTDEDAEIMVMGAPDAPALPPTPVTANDDTDVNPSWSPDGTRIAFTSDRDGGNQEVYSMTAAGTDQDRLTNDSSADRDPRWSPDESKIVYEANSSNIVVMDASGASPTPLGAGRDPDWQPIPTPIIFVHGFLASKLRCQTGSGFAELWPHIGIFDRPLLAAMELAPDGITDAGDGTCSGPVETDGLLELVGPTNADIHASTLEFIERAAPGAAESYAWDWRRSPEQALAGLDELVDEVRADHDDRKVAILAHSFGGLLTRWYIDDPDNAEKVERALIVGTPSWGSPKALFPLATGMETPAGGDLDPVLDEDPLKSFARNLTGNYFLYPSVNYGTWLTVQGHVPPVLDDPQEVVDYVNDDLLGTGPLLQQAYDAHANVLDGWETNDVDVRALVGTGLNTPIGVDLLPGQGTFAPDAAELFFGNGDTTVPARSAVQGTPGTSNPLGEDIPIRYVCGVSHVPLAGDMALSDAGADEFLTLGEELTAPTDPCTNGGFSLELYDVDLTPALAASRAHADGASADQSATEAEAARAIDLIRFPTMAFAVTNDTSPVNLEFPSPSARVVVRRLDGETQGAAQSFGPLPEGIQVVTSAGGTIEVGPIEQPPSGAPAPAPPSSGGGPAGSAAPDRTAPRVRVKVRRRGGRFVVRILASDPAGVRRIQYRFGRKGPWRTYRRPLHLTAARLRKLRVRATDHAGNVSRPRRARAK